MSAPDCRLRMCTPMRVADGGGRAAPPDPMQDLILDEDLAQNRYPAEKIAKEKASLAAGKHCSHMAEYVTAEMFEKYKGLKSGGLGEWTIARAINTGVQFPRAYM